MNSQSTNQEYLQDFGPSTTDISRCIRCGFCNSACPTSNVASAFKDSRTSRGRLILLQSIMENAGHADPYSEEFKELIDLCYSCRRCVAACPAGIPIPDLMSHARHAYLKHNGQSELNLGHRIYSQYGKFDHLGSTFAPISSWMLRRQFFRQVMEYVTHIDSRARLPNFQRETFESWFKNRPKVAQRKKIVYFVDSFANFNEPSIGKLTVNILERLGFEVIVPPQRESGMPAIEYGMLDQARDLAKYNLEQLEPFMKEGCRIVCSSPAATFLLRQGYGTILNDKEFLRLSGSVVDLAELCLEEYNQGTLKFPNTNAQPIQYHYCCLSKALSLGPVTSKLLDAAGFVQTQVEECCGGAGVWGTFKENYEMSHEIANKLAQKITKDQTLLTESETCRLQIEGHLDVSVRFPLELIADRAGIKITS
ncbi:MAG TPA: 4Fe-4S dicluster domain-containing protein [Candidatus Saccharimonadales bacterium]|nr:4Fe-4S dicluster domain-containing protein [Candidatus Saccharimonadales bacterium]